jgi:hypothetical protein
VLDRIWAFLPNVRRLALQKINGSTENGATEIKGSFTIDQEGKLCTIYQSMANMQIQTKV